MPAAGLQGPCIVHAVHVCMHYRLYSGSIDMDMKSAVSVTCMSPKLCCMHDIHNVHVAVLVCNPF